ncbi:hypothetical protein [Roseateles sp. LYH14W]|uniref:Uncharacterized protein n=1 Tax=Pelomonas parva TaxID=3299032 RepID=A0ABW7F924_9BURK
MRTLLTLAAAAAASLALVACGGGSDDDAGSAPGPGPTPTPLTAIPDGVIVSSDALVGYLNVQPTSDEISEALTLPAGEPFTSETAEPYSI